MQRFRPATEIDVDTILEMMRGYYADDESVWMTHWPGLPDTAAGLDCRKNFRI